MYIYIYILNTNTRRLPENTVNWTLVRSRKLEGTNALAEWRSMMSSWPVGEDGCAPLPTPKGPSLHHRPLFTSQAPSYTNRSWRGPTLSLNGAP